MADETRNATEQAAKALLTLVREASTDTLLELGDVTDTNARGVELSDPDDTVEAHDLMRAFSSMLWAQAEDRDKR